MNTKKGDEMSKISLMPLIREITKSGKRKTVKVWKPDGTEHHANKKHGRKNSEHNEQVAVFRWAALNVKKYPELVLMFAVPNAQKLTGFQGKWQKDEGKKAGVPDILLPAARSIYHGLFVEMKAGKNKPTPAQMAFIDGLREQGYRVEVCYSWQSVANVVEKYLLGEEW